VSSVDRDHEPPDHWEDICLKNSTYIAVGGPPEYLAYEWLTRDELDAKRRELDRQEIRLTSARGVQAGRINHAPPTASRTPVPEAESSLEDNSSTATSSSSSPTLPLPATVKVEGDSLPEGISSNVPPSISEGASTPPTSTGERRSNRTTAGQHQIPRYTDVFVSKVDSFSKSDGHDANMAYLAELHTGQDSGDIDISDPRIYAAKRKSDPDMPTFHEAMKGANAEDYNAAMKMEVKGLLSQKTWKTRPISDATKVIKSTWVFKLKRLPDGTPSKFKARFCVRGDLQTEGVDYFEIYAPVVQYCTVRMLLTLTIREGWATRQVDYTDAFAQAEMGETVYVEPPRLFGPRSGKDLVLLNLGSHCPKEGNFTYSLSHFQHD
jgi:hypothetical protein